VQLEARKRDGKSSGDKPAGEGRGAAGVPDRPDMENIDRLERASNKLELLYNLLAPISGELHLTEEAKSGLCESLYEAQQDVRGSARNIHGWMRPRG